MRFNRLTQEHVGWRVYASDNPITMHVGDVLSVDDTGFTMRDEGDWSEVRVDYDSDWAFGTKPEDLD